MLHITTCEFYTYTILCTLRYDEYCILRTLQCNVFLIMPTPKYSCPLPTTPAHCPVDPCTYVLNKHYTAAYTYP